MNANTAAQENQDRRATERDQVFYYFDIINAETGTHFGLLKDVSINGLRMLSKGDLVIGENYDLEIVFDLGADLNYRIPVIAQCRWTRDGGKPGYLESGFIIESYQDNAQSDLAAALQEMREHRTGNHPLQQIKDR